MRFADRALRALGAVFALALLMGADTSTPVRVVPQPVTPFVCAVTTTATTIATLAGCLAPGAGLKRYITSVRVGGGVATGATAPAVLTYGTGTNCATGATVVYRCDHPATSGCSDPYNTPLVLAANVDLCFTDAATGTKNVNVVGYVAP